MSGEGAGALRAPGWPAVAVEPDPSARVAVVVARWNADVTQRLLDGALRRLDELGLARERVLVAPVPGAFELPAACRAAAASRRFTAVVALGCVIRGETPHFDYVCAEAARGIAQASEQTGVPVSFGVLTTDTREQAVARAGGGAGDKGAEAVDAALELATVLRELRG
jgi:6,7-dimethyl-8-ribityllumazine synthase